MILFDTLSEEDKVRRINEADALYRRIRNGQQPEADTSSLDDSVQRLLEVAHGAHYQVLETTDPNPRIVLIGCPYKKYEDSGTEKEDPLFPYGVHFLKELLRYLWPKNQLVLEGTTHEQVYESEFMEAKLDQAIHGTTLDLPEKKRIHPHAAAELLTYLRDMLIQYHHGFNGNDSLELLQQENAAWNLADALKETHRRSQSQWAADSEIKRTLLLCYTTMAERLQRYIAPYLADLADKAEPGTRVYMAVRMVPLVFGEITAALQERGKGYISLVPARKAP